MGLAVYPTLEEAIVHPTPAINYFAPIPPYNQWGAVETLESTEGATAIRHMVDSFQRRRYLVVAGINTIDGVTYQNPKGAFYTFPNVGGGGGGSRAPRGDRRVRCAPGRRP